MKPFRWNIKKEEQLGRLTRGERSPAYPGFIGDLRECSSRLLSLSENGMVVFVGRSPESVFDYLSGVLEGTSRADNLVHLNISNRYENILKLKNNRIKSFQALKAHFMECSITPIEILNRKRKTLFADLVAEGGTFGQIAYFLFSWAEEEKIALKDFRQKIGFLGITWEAKTSPKTWRWQQHVEWVSDLQIRNIKNISIPGLLWDYLGNNQMKVSLTNPPKSWDSETILEPPREERNLKALRRAYDLFRKGKNQKIMFSDILAREEAIKYKWFRDIISELRGTAG